jgi:ribonuclease HI
MPAFNCSVCDETFEVPKAALDKYPGWEPKYCRQHSPNRKGSAEKKSRPRGTGKAAGKKRSGAAGRPSGSSRSPSGSSREENLTRAEVLEKYTDGPRTGVFTDGSSHPNPGPGGWGFVWVDDGQIQQEGHGAADDTTNNRMELQALIEAYRALPADASVTVFSDSQLCVNTITIWAPGWEAKGWTRKGAPLKNLDLVKPLLELYRAHPNCPLEWMRAHAGSLWNEYADSLATAWRRSEV